MTEPAFHEDWFSESSQAVLARLVDVVADVPGAIVEIGAWEGRSTIALANAAEPRIVLTCDTWEGSGHEISEKLAAERDVCAQWRANVAAHTAGNVREYRMGWRKFLPTVSGPIALAFIDAEHSYVEVADNIRALLPKMAPGGIICGDDSHHGPVRDAVFDVLGADATFADATVWIWQMPTEPHGQEMALLRGERPDLVPDDASWREAIETLLPMWKQYVETVSPLEQAASIQTCAYLWYLCSSLHPRRVLDLGSGLSSAVLRLYATQATHDVEVTSLDDDPQWEHKTGIFLRSQNLPTTGLGQWTGTLSGRYDLIFHDLAGGEVRNAAMPVAVAALADCGVIVFDDAHHESHAVAIDALPGLTVRSLGARTKDAIDRWSAIAWRSRPALADLYAERCATPSDIYQHLPMMVNLVHLLDAKHVIELGTRTGVSTVAWLHGLESTGGRLTSVDLDAKPPIGDWPQWTYLQGDDLDPAVVGNLDPAEIVFIDTSHHYEQTKRELDAYLPLVKPGGLIVLHDTELPWPMGAPVGDPLHPVKRAVVEFCNAHGFDWVNIPDCWGLGIIRVGER